MEKDEKEYRIYFIMDRITEEMDLSQNEIDKIKGILEEEL